MQYSKHQKKITLNSLPQTYQILKNDDQLLILCLSYFITTVARNYLNDLMCNIIFPENRSTDNGQMNFFNNCVHFMAE